jgi:hypothetical protein
MHCPHEDVNGNLRNEVELYYNQLENEIKHDGISSFK